MEITALNFWDCYKNSRFYVIFETESEFYDFISECVKRNISVDYMNDVKGDYLIKKSENRACFPFGIGSGEKYQALIPHLEDLYWKDYAPLLAAVKEICYE